MSNLPTVKIAPEVLKWARESIHTPKDAVVQNFSQVSKKTYKITRDSLDKIETEITPIKSTLLKEFSRLYKRPLAVFFLKKPPQDQKAPTDFRTQRNLDSGFSPATMIILRSAQRVQLFARELFEDLGEPIQFKLDNYKLNSNPVTLAAELRKTIGLDFESQKKFKTPDKFFAWLRLKLEGTGVFVIKEPFPTGDALAFSLTDEQPFVIVVNSKWGANNYAPKIFSLLHEYAHILLRHGGICNDFISSKEKIEIFCNRFAANFIIPQDLFNQELKRITKNFQLSNIDNYLTELGLIFKASKSALLVRFLERHLISKEFFDKRIFEANVKYSLRAKKEIPFRVFPHIRAINSMGRSFSELILRAVDTEKITRDSAADFLGVQPTQLGKIAEFLKKKT